MPNQIKCRTDKLIQKITEIYDNVGALDLDEVSFENTLKALADAKLEYAGKWYFISPHGEIHSCLFAYPIYFFMKHMQVRSSFGVTVQGHPACNAPRAGG